MSDVIDRAQVRIRARRKELGINGDLPFRKATGGREWAENRIAEWKAKGKLETKPGGAVMAATHSLDELGRGRHVRCVQCGRESRVETNRNRRLKTIKCTGDVRIAKDDDRTPAAVDLDPHQVIHGPVLCGGRLRPLNWFRPQEG